MTSISSLGPRQLDAWMVGKLFGSNEETKASSQNSASIKDTQITGDSHIGNSISSETAQAIVSLKKQSDSADDVSETSNTPRFFVLNGHSKSISQSNEIIKSNQSMTSDQINAAMYGDGIATAGFDVESPNTTFSDLVKNQQSWVQDQIQQSKDMSTSEDERQASLLRATQGQDFINQIQVAYQSHTLKFQNASDVVGLDFKQTVTYLGDDQNKAADIGVVQTETYNKSFYENRTDKSRSQMLDAGNGVMLYLTW